MDDDALRCCWCEQPIGDDDRGHALLGVAEEGTETLLFAHALCQDLREFEADLQSY